MSEHKDFPTLQIASLLTDVVSDISCASVGSFLIVLALHVAGLL